MYFIPPHDDWELALQNQIAVLTAHKTRLRHEHQQLQHALQQAQALVRSYEGAPLQKQFATNKNTIAVSGMMEPAPWPTSLPQHTTSDMLNTKTLQPPLKSQQQQQQQQQCASLVWATNHPNSNPPQEAWESFAPETIFP